MMSLLKLSSARNSDLCLYPVPETEHLLCELAGNSDSVGGMVAKLGVGLLLLVRLEEFG